MAVSPARIDRVVDVTRPVALDVDAGTAAVVATRWGLVLVQRERGWTWYRWMMAGQLWSVTTERVRDERQAQREAARLIYASRERCRRK